MKRQASIHITEHRLYLIIKDMMMDDTYSEDEAEQGASEMVERIMLKAKPFALDKRSITISNDKLAREVNKKASNNKLGYMDLAKIILMVRKDMRHKGIKMIDMNSSEYSSLKRLTEVINTFSDDWDLEFRESAIYFVKTGLSKITSFRNYIGKLCDMSESISLEYEASQIINEDKFKGETKRIHDIYVGMINTKTGLSEGYENNPMKYISFIRVNEISKKYNIEPKIFIEAQFDGLSWTDTFPEPNQLVSEKAIERLNKYLYTKKIKLGKPDRTSSDKNLTNILNRIKNGNDND